MNTLSNLFHTGGPLFMGILTILLIIILAMTVVIVIMIATGRSKGKDHFVHRISYLKAVGLFSMITGILAQLIGLVQAFGVIERVGDISPALVAGGVKVSMYTTLYGIGIYLLTILIWLLLDYWHHQKS